MVLVEVTSVMGTKAEQKADAFSTMRIASHSLTWSRASRWTYLAEVGVESKAMMPVNMGRRYIVLNLSNGQSQAIRREDMETSTRVDACQRVVW